MNFLGCISVSNKIDKAYPKKIEDFTNSFKQILYLKIFLDCFCVFSKIEKEYPTILSTLLIPPNGYYISYIATCPKIILYDRNEKALIQLGAKRYNISN